MRAVLPGKPQARIQAVDTVQWDGKRLVAYISGNAIIILGGPQDLIQTIYRDDETAYDALALDENTGKIAVSSPAGVDIYKPYGKLEDALKWSLESSIFTRADGSLITLSWGSDAELLTASSRLKLYQTDAANRLVWDCAVANPIKLAHFSQDACLLATTAQHDRLVKLWRRQAFGTEEARFDFTYLAHPQTITGIIWRKSHRHEHHVDNVLFSLCADHRVRIWAVSDPHGVQALQFWADIDMQESIQPRALQGPAKNQRYAFFIDSTDFALAADQAVQKQSPNAEGHALEHLLEVAKTGSEVCIVLDQYGNMSAWGMDHIGHGKKKSTDIFNIAHVDDFHLSFLPEWEAETENTQFSCFVLAASGRSLVLLIHYFDGRIEWLQSEIDSLLDPSPNTARFNVLSSWTGHDTAVQKIVRSRSGSFFLSCSSNNKNILWSQSQPEEKTSLKRNSVLNLREPIYQTLILGEGQFVVNLHRSRISVLDTTSATAMEVGSNDFALHGKPLCLVQLPAQAGDVEPIYLATITSKMEIIVWTAHLPSVSSKVPKHGHDRARRISEFCKSSLDTGQPQDMVVAIESAGSPNVFPAPGSPPSADIVLSCSAQGTLTTWTVTIDRSEDAARWIKTSSIETSITKPSLASVSSTRKSALVHSSKIRFTIWDQNGGQMEHDASFDSHETIQDLAWTATPEDQSILIVSFPYEVLIFSQLRYDYLHAGPAWASIREIHIREIASHPIGDSAWLGDGDLVIAAGNQLYVYDRKVDTSERPLIDPQFMVHGSPTIDIFDLVRYLNGTLPVFHPQFVGQCILAGKMETVFKVLQALHQKLKFYVDGDELDSLLNIPIAQFYETMPKQLPDIAGRKSSSTDVDYADDDEANQMTEEFALSLQENLTHIALPHISSLDQIHLAGILETVAAVEKHRKLMDNLAMRYLLIFRQHMLRKGEDPAIRVEISWREIVWAFHSVSQDILVDLVSRQFQGKMQWQHARESGMFMWITDISALRAQFEVVARNEYTKTDEKNPIDCSLYYLALKKKSVLLGLWRMAAWNREQSSTQKFLKNDFTETRWKTAALKNAYALLSKRRFEYAAAFFLLAGNLQDAVNVCAHQLEDLQLAIAIARVYDGDEGPVFRSLLEEKILPQAALEGNRWLGTWAFWMLGRHDMALRSLISPVEKLLDTSAPLDSQSKSYLTCDPSLVVLYLHLREQSAQSHKGAPQITTNDEWDFVLQSARLYKRMGCDLLALDLLRNFHFLPPPSLSPPSHLPTTESSPSSPNLQDPSDPTSATTSAQEQQQQQQQQKKKPQPTMFEEPKAESLLDSFGF